MSLAVLIGWLDAVRRRDRAAMRAMLADGATWQGIHPEWRCNTPEEIVEHWLDRAGTVADPDRIELTPTAMTVHAPAIAALDPSLRNGVTITFELDAEGRIAAMRDAPARSGP